MNRSSASGLAIPLCLLALPALGHIEYYDLNQGKHITDLTPAGKAASTAQYGTTPADVLALNGPPLADGISSGSTGLGLSAQQDLALSDTSLWNATYQHSTAVGETFSGVVYTPAASSATVDVTDVTDFAWADGTFPVRVTPSETVGLGDSHKVDFFNFRLSQTSEVTITWNVDTSGTFLDCAFTLYGGVLPYQGHDDAVEILNPFRSGSRVQDSLDTGIYRDTQGILSPVRATAGATAPDRYLGQFNALGNWGQANPEGNWSNVSFITAVNAKITQFSATASDTLETLTISLPPGNYTIAASGALGAAGSGASFGLTNLHGKLTFNAVAADTAPDPFVFTDRADVDPGVLSVSDAITVTGIDSPSPIGVSGDPSSEYSVNGGPFTGAAASVNDGDTVIVRHLSSTSFGVSVDTVLSIGGVTDTFTSTTGAADTTPDAYSFQDVSGVALETVQISNTITVTGIEAGAPISITGGDYSVNGGPYTSAAGVVNANDEITVRHTSASTEDTATDSTLTIGGVSDTFTSVTELAQSTSIGRVGGTASMDAFVVVGLGLAGWLRRSRRRALT